MNLRRWLRLDRRESAAADLRDLTLERMRPGFLLDYDMRTWEVLGRNTYDYGASTTTEWELRCGDEIRLLEREREDGAVTWTLSRRVPLQEVDGAIVDTMAASGDPPEEMGFEGRRYHAAESGAGLYREGGEGEGREFVVWSYQSDDGRLLFVSQWGERDFSAYEGEHVQEYQFTDILPGTTEE